MLLSCSKNDPSLKPHFTIIYGARNLWSTPQVVGRRVQQGEDGYLTERDAVADFAPWERFEMKLQSGRYIHV